MDGEQLLEWVRQETDKHDWRGAGHKSLDDAVGWWFASRSAMAAMDCYTRRDWAELFLHGMPEQNALIECENMVEDCGDSELSEDLMKDELKREIDSFWEDGK